MTVVNSAEILRQFFCSSQISTGVASMRYSGSTMLSLRLAPHIILQCGPSPRNQQFLVTILISFDYCQIVVGLGIVPSLTVKGHLGLSLAYG